ncbi:hypothetical protein O0I10_005207 [Lichtheimia ornata]|uniref:Uncharacterized protein n=1 Tax=Lichtheimia ornata TaxID=688661 RepID=A0AAD7Y000_9FUNG|nr:uncharacterized protein O0I10_005207 [Lichtheimia ornata]KAJ8659168.1 hypothetical protein O0I10_005207 [Lichtheimia ornata]
MGQVAADAFGQPVAVYQTKPIFDGEPEPPRLHLPLDPPARNMLSKPLILHLVGNHYYPLIIKPSIRLEWPPVPFWHRELWDERQPSQSYKATWKYLHIKKAKPGTQFTPNG